MISSALVDVKMATLLVFMRCFLRKYKNVSPDVMYFFSDDNLIRAIDDLHQNRKF